MPDLSGSFISIDSSNKTANKSSIQQLVDIVQADIASTGSTTRKSYEVFTSGGLDLNPITSSLYQTVYDQDFTLGTSNPLFDVSIGSYSKETVDSSGNITIDVNGIAPTYDAGGKLIGFANSTAMMREKVHIYKQFAQNLLGNANAAFVAPHGEVPPVTPSDTPAADPKNINAAVFICFRRLFTRDNIYKGSFGLKLSKKASLTYQDFVSSDTTRHHGTSISNIDKDASSVSTDNITPYIIDDSAGLSNTEVSPIAGEVSTLKDDVGNPVGLIYYDSGIIVLDAERCFDPDQIIRGLIDSTRQGASQNTVTNGPFYVWGKDSNNTTGYYYPLYTTSDSGTGEDSIAITPIDILDANGVEKTFYYDAAATNPAPSLGVTATFRPTDIPLWTTASNLYYSNDAVNETIAGDGKSLISEKLYPNLWVSGTIDTVLDHICTTRFGRGNMSAISFRNETVINSSLIFCRAAPSQFNYSTNPTYTDEEGNIIALDTSNNPFSFVTTIGLYDANRSLLAVAKTSRPIEKNPETDLSIRIRLDY